MGSISGLSGISQGGGQKGRPTEAGVGAASGGQGGGKGATWEAKGGKPSHPCYHVAAQRKNTLKK